MKGNRCNKGQFGTQNQQENNQLDSSVESSQSFEIPLNQTLDLSQIGSEDLEHSIYDLKKKEKNVELCLQNRFSYSDKISKDLVIIDEAEDFLLKAMNHFFGPGFYEQARKQRDYMDTFLYQVLLKKEKKIQEQSSKIENKFPEFSGIVQSVHNQRQSGKSVYEIRRDIKKSYKSEYDRYREELTELFSLIDKQNLKTKRQNQTSSLAEKIYYDQKIFCTHFNLEKTILTDSGFYKQYTEFEPLQKLIKKYTEKQKQAEVFQKSNKTPEDEKIPVIELEKKRKKLPDTKNSNMCYISPQTKKQVIMLSLSAILYLFNPEWLQKIQKAKNFVESEISEKLKKKEKIIYENFLSEITSVIEETTKLIKTTSEANNILGRINEELESKETNTEKKMTTIIELLEDLEGFLLDPGFKNIKTKINNCFALFSKIKKVHNNAKTKMHLYEKLHIKKLIDNITSSLNKQEYQKLITELENVIKKMKIDEQIERKRAKIKQRISKLIEELKEFKNSIMLNYFNESVEKLKSNQKEFSLLSTQEIQFDHAINSLNKKLKSFLENTSDFSEEKFLSNWLNWEEVIKKSIEEKQEDFRRIKDYLEIKQTE